MTAHKHAALMLQYAQDAAETDEPWERWEYSDTSTLNQHGEKICDDWFDCRDNPDWHPNVQYRRKPQIIKVTVNGKKIGFPEPVKIAPPDGTRYWMPTQRAVFGFDVQRYIWEGDDGDFGFLNHGLIHLSPEAAQAHADVLNAICRGDID